jgi:hypothetical protein
VVRTLDVTDRLLVVARPSQGDDGRVRLEPPPGGFVITNLALDDAMRVLGGPKRTVAVAGVVGIAVGAALVVIGAVGALLSALI